MNYGGEHFAMLMLSDKRTLEKKMPKLVQRRKVGHIDTASDNFLAKIVSSTFN
jgi:hypothetical protein